MQNRTTAQFGKTCILYSTNKLLDKVVVAMYDIEQGDRFTSENPRTIGIEVGAPIHRIRRIFSTKALEANHVIHGYFIGLVVRTFFYTSSILKHQRHLYCSSVLTHPRQAQSIPAIACNPPALRTCISNLEFLWAALAHTVVNNTTMLRTIQIEYIRYS